MYRYRSLLAASLLLVAANVAHAQSTALPQWKLQESRDSFVINIEGRPMGFMVLAVEALKDGGFRVTDNTQIGEIVRQKTEMLLDNTHRLKRVNQAGTMRGQDARIAVEYDGKKVKGAATRPGPDGATSFVIDTPVPVNVVDDNLLQPMFAVLPWSANARWTIPVFSAGKNQLNDMILVVMGTEALNTPLGTVDTYHAELRGPEMTVGIWVSKAAPHRVLKTAPVGAPFEVLRVN